MKFFTLLSLCITLSFIALSISPLKAQAQADTPEVTAADYMEAVKAQDWMAAAHLVHPDDLDMLKRSFVQAVDSAVAREEDPQDFLDLLGLDSLKALTEAAAPSLFARFVGQSMEAQMGGLQDDADSSLASVFASMTYGNPTRLSELDDVVYLSLDVSVDMGTEPFTYSEVLEVKKHENQWRIGISKLIEAVEYML